MASTPDAALVTGVCGDLGRVLAAHFLDRGRPVLGLDLAKELPEGLRGRPGLTFVSCDLSVPAAAEEAVDAYVAAHGPLRVVVNNLGLIFSAPVVNLADGEVAVHPAADFDRVVAVSLSSAFYVTAACVKHMVKAGGGGVVVNISSVCARGNPGQSAYSAAKAGLNGMTVSQAKELGPLGIRVVAVAPGFLDTPSTARAMGEDGVKRIKRSVPLRRLGTPAELAHAVQFAVDNGYLTGTVLELDGGLAL